MYTEELYFQATYYKNINGVIPDLCWTFCITVLRCLSYLSLLIIYLFSN